MAGKKKRSKRGKDRRTEALDNIEYATLRTAGELSDMQHTLDEMLDVLRELRSSLVPDGAPAGHNDVPLRSAWTRSLGHQQSG